MSSFSQLRAEVADPAGSGTEGIGRAYLAPVAIGSFSLVVMITMALVYDLPIRDPDARYVGSPLALIGVIAGIFLLLDLIPRGWTHSRREGVSYPRGIVRVLRLRWLGKRGAIVLLCLLSFYATYLSYRNLKSFIPFVTDANHDLSLFNAERFLFFGNDPAVILHDVLGTGIAPFLSFIYLLFLLVVPISLAVALVWSDRLAVGVWYVTALSLTWILGAISYYLIPAMGPVYERPGLFAGLPETGVTGLQDKLLEHRGEVLLDPASTNAVQSIAAFASLHIAVVFTAALVAQLLGVARWFRVTLWTFLGLTAIATVYFGWHYVVDDVAGLCIGTLAVFLSAKMTGVEVHVPFRSRALTQRRTAT